MLLSGIVASFLVSGVLSKGTAYTPRTRSQIREFVFSPVQPCPNSIFDSGNGNCKTDAPVINPCSDGVTYCPNNAACGTWGGMAGCCLEQFDPDKSSTPGDPTQNTSCKAYEQQLSHFNFTPQSGGLLPSSIFCDLKLFPDNTILVGGFSGENSNISVDNTGQVCCPNYLDAVVRATDTGLNQTEALCVPWFVKDGQTNSSGSATSSSASSTSTSSGATSLFIAPSTLGATVFAAFATAFFYAFL